MSFLHLLLAAAQGDDLAPLDGAQLPGPQLQDLQHAAERQRVAAPAHLDAQRSARAAEMAVYTASYSCGRGLSDIPPSIVTHVRSGSRFTAPTR